MNQIQGTVTRKIDTPRMVPLVHIFRNIWTPLGTNISVLSSKIYGPSLYRGQL